MVGITLDTGHTVYTIETFESVMETIALKRGGGYLSVRKRDRTFCAIGCAAIVLVEELAPKPKLGAQTETVTTPEPQVETVPAPQDAAKRWSRHAAHPA